MLIREQDPIDAGHEAIVTDRPDITESSIVVPKGSLQFENGLTWTAQGSRGVLDASETLIRFGLLSRTELRVVAPNYDAGLGGMHAGSGFGDLAIGFKQQIGPLAGAVDLSVIAAVSVPSGAARVTSHGFDPFVKFPWSKELGSRWSIGGMQSFFWLTEDRKRNPTWESTFYLEREIVRRAVAFVEYGGDFTRASTSKQIAHFGAAYKISPKQLIDFHFGVGLTRAAPDRLVGIGYSFRIDGLRGR
jgi:hypothetical protein